MNLIQLKESITNGIIPSDFLILVTKDNQFLATQYIQAIGKLANGGLNKVNSIYEPQQSTFSLLVAPTDAINVLYTDIFIERSEDYSQFKNTIVVCEQVDKSIAKSVEDYTIKLPKLEEWQILDYAKTICSNIEDEDLLWLIKITDNNIERILNELDKVALFKKTEQKAIFNSIRFDQQTDLFKIDLFTIINALVDGNTLVLYDFLRNADKDTIEPVMLANRVLTNLKNIILVSKNLNLTAADCGISAGQFNFIKRNYYNLNVEAVKQKIKFLTNFDLALKTSKLDLSKRDMLSYLVNNLCYKITL